MAKENGAEMDTKTRRARALPAEGLRLPAARQRSDGQHYRAGVIASIAAGRKQRNFMRRPGSCADTVGKYFAMQLPPGAPRAMFPRI